ncbi:MAG: aldehyde dehydrogenase family protein, partial [Spirochaetaceae bacterium]|nr:aldehyde dehydrogenase family protein [Spirochaetaceae bacterium]
MSNNTIPAIVAAAREGQTEWAKFTISERRACLGRARRYLGERIDEVTEAIHHDNGKLPLDALATEVLPA